MAFVYTADLDTLHVDIFRRGNGHLIQVHVGYDTDSDVNYALMVGLEPAPAWEAEFFFCLIRVEGASYEEEPLWDARYIGQIISRSDRDKVRDLLLQLSAHLAVSLAPSHFFMSTRDAHLPPRALEKYEKLCEVFTHCGYKVAGCDPYHGRHLWCMERSL